jgi:23S rRNA G2445 N2-methylase RlmL
VSAFEDVTIGECRLILGDCRDVLPGLPPVDLVLTDPPYGIKLDKGMGVGGFDSTGRYRRKPRAYEGGWDDQAPAADLFEMVIAKAKVIAANSHTVQAGRIRMSHLGRSGFLANRDSTACMATLATVTPFS